VRRVGVMTSEKIMDVLIVGAGATGLATWRELHRASLRVQVIEARDRLGGRILTNYSTPTPIELGAEFIHGRPEMIHSILEEAQLPVIEVLGKHLVYDKDHRLGPIFTRSSRASTGR
jgi:monoamine oxidase